MNETKLSMGVQCGHLDGYVPIIKFYSDTDCKNELASICLSPSMLITLEKQISGLQKEMIAFMEKEYE